MASSSRGLPGFVRRSLRADYSEDDDEDELDESGSSASASSALDASKTVDQPSNLTVEDGTKGRQQPQSSPAILSNTMERQGNDGANSSFPSRSSMPPPQTPQPAPLNRRSSEPSALHSPQHQTEDGSKALRASDEQQEPNSTQQELSSTQQRQEQRPKKKKTYRETQFEKIFSASVISMNDLRTLAWNGIPVCIFTGNFVFLGQFHLRPRRHGHSFCIPDVLICLFKIF
jgi:hypothetical protein